MGLSIFTVLEVKAENLQKYLYIVLIHLLFDGIALLSYIFQMLVYFITSCFKNCII